MTFPVSHCRACSARIFFAKTSKSERMPIDYEPVANGNLAVTASANGLPTAVVLRLAQAVGMRADGKPTYVSHFAGCPAADAFRKKTRNEDRASALRRKSADRSRGRARL